MSKAEERALERFPVHEGASKEWIEMHLKGVCADYIEGYRQAEKDLTDKARLSSGWDGFYYGQGYKQAEKDLELTWEDIKEIYSITFNLRLGASVFGEPLYQEVLKRFKEREYVKQKI